MRGRRGSSTGAFQVALLLWHLVRGCKAGGCNFAEEASRLQCQLDEARTLLSRQSAVIEEKDVELARKAAMLKEKEAVIMDLEAQLARKEAQDALSRDVGKGALIEEPRHRGAGSFHQRGQTERPPAQKDWKEQADDPDRWQPSHRRHYLAGKASRRSRMPYAWRALQQEQLPDDRSGYHSDLEEGAAKEGRHGRLLATADLPAIIAALPTNTTRIDLKSSNLKGTLPADLGRFVYLEYLDVSRNLITGTIPPELGNLTQLTTLSLNSNRLTGTIPQELGNLVRLGSLVLSKNQLNGAIPPELGNLTQLTVLSLDSNGLTGTIPPALCNLTQLIRWDLSSNGLTGTVPPELGKLTQLQDLWLNNNRLTAPLPQELGNLVGLESLDLSYNPLNGTIPPELGNLTQLIEVIFSHSGLTGTFPPEMCNLMNLAWLELGDNGLTGTIQPELGNLTQLYYFSMTNNRLTGTIPPELGNLVGLWGLRVGGNRLHGTVPAELGDLTETSYLVLCENRLTGTVPAELGNLAVLSLYLHDNQLTGTIPPELCNIAGLQELSLHSNRLTGTLPSELGSVVSLKKLNLAGNLFSGTLPGVIVRLQALRELDVSNNPGITGTFPDTRRSKLPAIVAAGCGFTSAGPVGDAVKTISFANNNLTELPAAWVNLPRVLELDVSYNHIEIWRPHGVLPPDTWDSGGNYRCGVMPLEGRLNWPVIQSVKLSGNPFGRRTTTRDFLWSLAYLTSLSELFVAGCQLQGDVPMESLTMSFGTVVENAGPCGSTPSPDLQVGFVGLLTLDMSDNNMTALSALPPPRLSLADLHSNPLRYLHAYWYKVPRNLVVWNNSFLRVDVAPPLNESGCSTAGASTSEATAQADPLGFATKPGEDAFQCTTLCAGVKTQYKHDASLNVSSLCRCTVGRQGAAANCTGCPADTYSHADAKDRWAMVRTCRPCPAQSSTGPVENASSVDQCKCQAGWYMEMGAAASATATPACKRCKQGRFMDTLPGSTQETACFCNASYDGLRAVLGTCGCADGLYMDHVARACRRCDPVAEACTWGAAVERSLLPPAIKASYWAVPQPEAAEQEAGPDQASNFSEHDIWRCFSRHTCLGNGTCAVGRSGTACSLCADGMYGGPDGPCHPCPYNPEEARKNLLCGLLVGPVATIAAHMLLNFRTDSRGQALTLGKLRTSGKQSLKYLQMLGVMAGFNVDWPPLALQFLSEVSRITVALPHAAGVACLAGQQTASLEMCFRWLMPVAGLISACLSALVLAPIRSLGRQSRFYECVRMGYWDVLRVTLWGLALFYSTLLQFGTQMLACAPGPNGMRTVVTFPHLQCGGGGEWNQLAAISCAFLLVFVGAVFLGVYAAWRRATRALVESKFESTGWWGFLFDDYRAGWGHWLMLTMAKDAALVVIATAGAADGPSQLLATAAVSTMYSYVVLRDQPFRDASNSLLEAWTMMSVAVLSVFTAGMGFQSATGVADVVVLYGDGASDPEYKKRERALLVVQCLTFVGPAGIALYQLLCASEKVRNKLPPFIRPPTEQERAKWNGDFFTSVRLDEALAPDLWGLIDRFDVIDSARFRDLMGTSTATLGVVHSRPRGVSIKRLVWNKFMDVVAAAGVLDQPAKLPAAGAVEEEDHAGAAPASDADQDLVGTPDVAVEEDRAVTRHRIETVLQADGFGRLASL